MLVFLQGTCNRGDSCPFVHNPAKAAAKTKSAATAKPAAVAFVVGPAGISGASASSMNIEWEFEEIGMVDVQVTHCILGETFRCVVFVSIQLLRFNSVMMSKTSFLMWASHSIESSYCVSTFVPRPGPTDTGVGIDVNALMQRHW